MWLHQSRIIRPKRSGCNVYGKLPSTGSQLIKCGWEVAVAHLKKFPLISIGHESPYMPSRSRGIPTRIFHENNPSSSWNGREPQEATLCMWPSISGSIATSSWPGRRIKPETVPIQLNVKTYKNVKWRKSAEKKKILENEYIIY